MMELRDFTFVHKYFIGEKQESLLFLIIGIAAIALAVVFIFSLKQIFLFLKALQYRRLLLASSSA